MSITDIKAPEREALLRSVRDMRGYKIFATDGAIGEVEDLLFDDEKWVVRHFVVSTYQREVLLSPISFSGADWDARIMHVNLTLEQIRNSPDIDTDLPISRKAESEYYDFFGWPYYWGGVYTTPGGIYPISAGLMGTPVRNVEEEAPEPREFTPDEIHLRSADEVMGHHVDASDGSIGRVEDFIIHDEHFHVQYVVIDTSPWWFGGKILFPTDRILTVSWPGRLITLDASRSEVKAAPHWDHAKPVCKTYAGCINEHYK